MIENIWLIDFIISYLKMSESYSNKDINEDMFQEEPMETLVNMIRRRKEKL